MSMVNVLRMVFQFIGMSIRYTLNGIGRTNPGNGTFVALLALLLVNLQEQGTIAEGSASLYAFATTRAEILINGIFEIGLLHKFPGDGSCGTHHVLRSCVQFLHIGAIIPATQVTVTTHLVGMEALHRRDRQHTIRLASSALSAFVRVNLPKDFPFLRTRFRCK